MKKTVDLKIKTLGIVPNLHLAGAKLSPQQIAAFSGLLTFRGQSLSALVRETKTKKQDVEQKVKNILKKSALRGHASMGTLPVFCFSFEASKMIGSMLTGITFSSALMHSGRRSIAGKKDIIFPSSILKNKKAYELYQETSVKNLQKLSLLLEKSALPDEAGKLAQYGTYGTGVVALPVESFVTFVHEYQKEKKWFPEEAGLLIGKIEKETKKMGVDLLYATRFASPKNTYPYPNLFKDPKETNLTRDLVEKTGLLKKDQNFELISLDSALGRGFLKTANELKKEQDLLFKNPAELKKNWRRTLFLRRKLIRDYGNGINLRLLSNVSWRVWRDKKRHRTAPVTTESVYYCVDQALLVFNRLADRFKKKNDLTEKEIGLINKVCAIPPILAKDSDQRRIFLAGLFDCFETYQKLVALGIPESDALMIIPRALRIRMVQEYNLFNLIDGYYSLRSCVTADEQILKESKGEIGAIKKALNKNGLAVLADLMEPKCVVSGFCPEENTCGYLKKFFTKYDQKLHQGFKDDLEKDLQKKLDCL